jgi:hypothetical protein
VQIVLEQRTQLDGNTTDDRFNSTNPGGTDVFGRAASTENKGYFCTFCWLDYKFEGIFSKRCGTARMCPRRPPS